MAKMKSWLISSLFFLGFPVANAQFPQHVWTECAGSTFNESVIAITEDKWGNVIYGGTLTDITDLDPGPLTYLAGAAGIHSDFVCKVSPDGKFIWGRAIQSGGFNTVLTDGYGNVFLAGWFGGICDFDPGPGTYTLFSGSQGDTVATQGYYILKLTSTGSFVDAVCIPSAYIAVSSVLSVDSAQNLLFAGTFGGARDLDPGPAVNGFTAQGSNADAFLLKLDNDLNLIWAKQFKATKFAVLTEVNHSPVGDIILAGFVEGPGNVDMDPGPGTTLLSCSGINQQHALVAALDAAGNFKWAKQVSGSTGGSRLMSLAVSSGGFMYGSISIGGTVDIDPGLGVTNINSAAGMALLVKMTPLADLVMHDTIAFAGKVVLNRDSVIIAGNFTGSVDLDPGPSAFIVTSSGGYDIGFFNLDTLAQFGWGASFGGSGTDQALDFSASGVGEFYLCGSYQNTVDFDPGAGILNRSSLGMVDGFVSKLSVCKSLPSNLSDPFVCAGSAATLVAGGASAISWYSSLSASSPVAIGSVVVTPTLAAGDHIYYAESASCPSGLRKPILVVANPQPVITVAGIATVCAGNTVTFEASGADSYTWSTGQQTSIVSFTPVSSMQFTVTGTNSLSCKASETVGVSYSLCQYLEEPDDGFQFRGYPNPASGVYELVLSEACKIQLIDQEARLLHEETFDPGLRFLTLDGYSAGVYFLRLYPASARPRLVKLVVLP